MKRRILEILCLIYIVAFLLLPFFFIYFEEDLATRLLSSKANSALEELHLLPLSQKKIYIEPLLKAVQSGNPLQSERAQIALHTIGPAILPKLIQFTTEPFTDPKNKPLLKLAYTFGPSVLKELLPLLNSERIKQTEKVLFFLTQLTRKHPQIQAQDCFKRISELPFQNEPLRSAVLSFYKANHLKEAIPLLLALFEKENQPLDLAITLAHLENTKGFPVLLQHLQYTSSEHLLSVLESLCFLEIEALPAVPALLSLLSSENPQIRKEVMITLRWIQAKSLLPQLRPFLEDPDMTVRRHTLRTLRWLGEEDGSAFPFLCEALENKDFDVRREAVWGLGDLGAKFNIDLAPVVPKLLELVHDFSSFTVENTVYTLTLTKTPLEKMLAVLCQRLEQNYPEPTSKIKAIEFSARLLEMLESSSVALRQETAKTLRWLGHKADFALASLGLALQDPDWLVRGESAWALGNLRQISSVPLLIKILQQDPHKHPRENAAWALGEMVPFSEDIEEVLVSALHDSQPDVRYNAAASLVRQQKSVPAALAVIRTAPKYPKPYIRKHLVDSLALCSHPEALAVLKLFWFDPDEVVRRHTRQHYRKKS